jgi:hypothetical protein
MHGLTKILGTTVTYPEDRKWQAVGPLDEMEKGSSFLFSTVIWKRRGRLISL